MKIELQELSLAATLLALNFVPSIQKINDKKYTFSFENTPELQKAIDSYWKNQMVLNPKLYWNCVRELKARMYG